MHLEPKPDTDAAAQDAAAQETPVGAAPRGVSAIDELRAAYTAIDNQDDPAHTETFPIPGTRTVVRYRRLGQEQSTEALTSPGSQWERNAQFLVKACDEILVRNDQGELEPVIPGQRVTFDLRPGVSIPLHQALGVDEPDIRRSVLRLFQGAERPLLIHAAQVDAWMDTLHERAREQFAGG